MPIPLVTIAQQQCVPCKAAKYLNERAVEAVTKEDVRLFAETLADSANPAVAVVGCGKSSNNIAQTTLEQLAA